MAAKKQRGKGNNRPQQFKPGNPFRWKPGQSGNPEGRPSLGTYFNRIMREVAAEEGGKKIDWLEAFARKLRRWAMDEDPSKHLAPRQILALKAFLDRFDPVKIGVQVDHNVTVGVALTPAARQFEDECRRLAAENGGKLDAVTLQRIRSEITVTDEDLGIENGPL